MHGRSTISLGQMFPAGLDDRRTSLCDHSKAIFICIVLPDGRHTTAVAGPGGARCHRLDEDDSAFPAWGTIDQPALRARGQARATLVMLTIVSLSLKGFGPQPAGSPGTFHAHAERRATSTEPHDDIAVSRDRNAPDVTIASGAFLLVR